MSERSRNYLILLCVGVALAGVAVLAYFRPVVLGLDLQGGLEVTLQANPKPGETPPSDYLDRSLSIVRSRVDKLGVSEPEIRKEGNNRIVVALAGVKDPERAQQIIGKTAKLYLIPLEPGLWPGVSTSAANGAPVARASLFEVLDAAKGTDEAKSSTEWYAFNAKTKQRLQNADGPIGPYESKADAEAAVKKLPNAPKDTVVLGVPEGALLASCDVEKQGCIGTPTSVTGGNVWYLFKLPKDKNLVLEGSQITDARADIGQFGGNVVRMSFSDKGAGQFHDITRLLAQGGQDAAALNPGDGSENAVIANSQHFAVVLDNVLESAPYINYRQYPDGIPGDTGAEISNIPSSSEAKETALVLQTGSLPVEFETISSQEVSASLGEASLRQGLIAGIAGLLAVMIYLLVIYRFLGLIADLALLMYAAFFLGIIILIPITMTLPGIAGMILTIGVAADANIVIFERIKEEVRVGKSIRAAIHAGYTKGFKTIIDANVITLITAGVLFIAGTGSVKGFAFTLAVGVILSMFSAVLATRAMLGVLGNFSWFNNASFMGASAAKVRWHADIVGRWKLWFAISGAAIVIGLGSLAISGLNLGIDFEGGTRVTTNIGQPATQQQVSDVVAKFADNAVVQGTGSSTDGRYKAYQISAEQLPARTATALREALSESFGGISNDTTESVSASFGSEILRGAMLAVIFSLLLITIYVTARFEFKFAVPMLVAMLHDVLLTVGIYSLLGREVTGATVAAVLTVLGYSLYDTIIVFDRVRENVPLLRKNTFRQIVNVSIWETLTRSINTSLITLVPILSLIIFGGSTLKDFAFALGIGIASGAYSTIFLASPLLALLKEREPEYRRRLGGAAIQKATLTQVEVPAAPDEERVPAMAGAAVAGAEGSGDGGGAAPVDHAPDQSRTVDGLTEAERADREAARRRRMERRRRPHGRAR